jgi:amino acid permease
MSTTEKSPNHEGVDSTSFSTDQEQGSFRTTDAGTGTRRLQRKLGVKEVQLFALSAAIGTSASLPWPEHRWYRNDKEPANIISG